MEDISQQIYSLPPLATWVPARDVFDVFIVLYKTNQLAAQVEESLAINRSTKTNGPTRAQLFSSILKKIDSLKCSDRLAYEMLDSIDELPSCQEGNSAQVLF